MVRDALRRFVKISGDYETALPPALLNTLYFNEHTVAAISYCGHRAGTVFLSNNFTRVFGYSRTCFLQQGIRFLLAHMHPEDVGAFIQGTEKSAFGASAWSEVGDAAVQTYQYRLQHADGRWLWITQKVIVLSVTPEQHTDTVLLLFYDDTVAKAAEQNQMVALVEKHRAKSKLLDELAAFSSQAKVVSFFKEHGLLTAREKEIAQLVAQGLSSKEIAGRLFISKHTVESHRKHLLQKLRVRNSSQMVHQSLAASFT